MLHTLLIKAKPSAVILDVSTAVKFAEIREMEIFVVVGIRLYLCYACYLAILAQTYYQHDYSFYIPYFLMRINASSYFYYYYHDKKIVAMSKTHHTFCLILKCEIASYKTKNTKVVYTKINPPTMSAY